MDSQIRELERQWAASGSPEVYVRLLRAYDRAEGRRSSAYRLSYRDRDRLSEAIQADHPCEDASCDIAAALEAGYPEAAAHLLIGATECPALDVALESIDIYGERPWPCPQGWEGWRWYPFPRGWEEWVGHFEENSVHCEPCGAYIYVPLHHGFSCPNCLRLLPEEEEDD